MSRRRLSRSPKASTKRMRFVVNGFRDIPKPAQEDAMASPTSLKTSRSLPAAESARAICIPPSSSRALIARRSRTHTPSRHPTLTNTRLDLTWLQSRLDSTSLVSLPAGLGPEGERAHPLPGVVGVLVLDRALGTVSSACCNQHRPSEADKQREKRGGARVEGQKYYCSKAVAGGDLRRFFCRSVPWNGLRSRPAIAPPIVRGRHASQNAERLKLDATTVFEADEPREEVERLRGEG